jgi:hypothetical protein
MAATKALVGWKLTISPEDCAAERYTIACKFQLYNNPSSLTETQSISTPMPKHDKLTLPLITKAFFWSNITALVL